MNTSYRRDIVSPIQLKSRPYDIQTNRAVQDEIRKNICTLHFTAEFAEDTQTLQAFKNIPGVVGFICTLRKDGKDGPILGFGRGMTVINKLNRYLEKTVSFAANASLIDSVVRATKMLDALHIDFTKQNTAAETTVTPVEQETYGQRENEFVPITPRQRGYLLKLLENIGADDSEINSVDEMSKSDAAGRISKLAATR